MATHIGPVSLTNHCGESKSPYVRQHVSNATAWQLWTPETLDLAKRTNRLLFVSIGYSACHWCHVMAHESFEHPRIAQLLNEHFIPVKIDREERPDIDRQYMDFLQATSGGGGWPLNVFVTPDLQPVFGGTYWPGPDSGRSRAGTTFEDILKRVSLAWKEQESRIRESGKQITQQLREFAQEGTLGDRAADSKIDDADANGVELDALEESYQHWLSRFDDKYGGFGGAPKFPTPMHLRHLLALDAFGEEVKEIVGEAETVNARHMVLRTLEGMRNGGIKDQVGHGFARYSVTRDWSLPHFEKMLYDNAQLLSLYLDAYLVTRQNIFLETVQDIAAYLTSAPMASPTGGINASEDADSAISSQDHEKSEGAFYVWTIDELSSLLDAKELEVVTKYWGVQANGNVDGRFDVQGELKGKNTLAVQITTADLAAHLNMTEHEITRTIATARQKVLAHREQNRPRPGLDDKIVTSWNGLAISGLARASAALQSSHPDLSTQYLDAATKAATFIHTELYIQASKTLRRVYREGPGDTAGFAEDYAFLILGLIDLYEATFDSAWLEWAETLQQTQLAQFWDKDRHGFFSTAADQPDILVRTKDGMDNAEPSTNGVSANNLFRLSSLLNSPDYEKKARQTVCAFEVEIGQHPGLFSGMLSSVVASQLGTHGLIITGQGPVADLALRKARESLRPNYTVLRVGGGVRDEWIRKRNELLHSVSDHKEMVQLCEGTSCKLLERADVEQLFGSSD
ncbi:hypothetical protein AMS68_007670 [Peltaster fructicola]|uniref:Spermatogenesis-associated protein 20-like TRX domain-containing protein n=1 Tax=Peltaster fructicola TaxID=286661 RepID=A0A6H0Y573_9PEZI|nr:hypothetical protein AMS68_007670 [Peltaster fructicola]